MWSWVGGGSGEILGGVVGGEIVTRMYCMEKHFQLEIRLTHYE